MRPLPPDRLLPLRGTYNFRDLGGYPAAGGRRTRWSRLYRSDTLQELSEADVEALAEIGLATIVDLRTATEVEREGRGPLATAPLRYLHLSVLREEGGETVAAPAAADGDLAARYLWYLDIGREALAEAIAVIADDASHPLVFHCTAGKDRTGVLAALVLDCLGVDHAVIVEDYLLTAARLDLIVERLRRNRAYAHYFERAPAVPAQMSAATMERFLAALTERHGGAASWAIVAGVDPAAIERLRDSLLEPDGTGEASERGRGHPGR